MGEKYLADKLLKRRKKRKIIPNIVDTSFRSNAQGQSTALGPTVSRISSMLG
jgi:hypothetical protein